MYVTSTVVRPKVVPVCGPARRGSPARLVAGTKRPRVSRPQPSVERTTTQPVNLVGQDHPTVTSHGQRGQGQPPSPGRPTPKGPPLRVDRILRLATGTTTGARRPEQGRRAPLAGEADPYSGPRRMPPAAKGSARWIWTLRDGRPSATDNPTRTEGCQTTPGPANDGACLQGRAWPDRGKPCATGCQDPRDTEGHPSSGEKTGRRSSYP